MSKKALALALALVLILAGFALVGCSAEEPADTTEMETPANPAFANLIKGDGKTILVGTDAPYVPFENVVNGVYEGFDVDLYNAVAAEIGATLEFKTFGFDPIIASLSADSKEFDTAISAMTITPERAETMLFSDPYFAANQSLTVTTGSPIKTVDDLKKGMKLAVQLGTTGDIWARENLEPKGIEIKTYDQGIGCLGALQAGDVDAVIVDFPVATEFAKDAARNAAVVQQIETNELYGIAFSKSNSALRDEVNKGLAAVKANGKYSEIYKKWFGMVPPSIP